MVKSVKSRLNYLVGGIPTPVKNMSSSVGMKISQRMESQKKIHGSSHHQPENEAFKPARILEIKHKPPTSYYNHQPTGVDRPLLSSPGSPPDPPDPPEIPRRCSTPLVSRDGALPNAKSGKPQNQETIGKWCLVQEKSRFSWEL